MTPPGPGTCGDHAVSESRRGIVRSVSCNGARPRQLASNWVGTAFRRVRVWGVGRRSPAARAHEGGMIVAYVLMFTLLSLLILIHEMGHLAGAKLVRIPVSQFSVGFGPKLCGVRLGGTQYRLSAIPLGGYVLPDVADPAEFNRLPAPARVLFSLAGPLGNLMAAFLVSSAMAVASSGLSFHSAVTVPLAEIWNASVQVLASIPLLFHHPDRLSGVLGIVASGGRYAGTNVERILHLSILLNVNLAIFNLLPLPPLDGGKVLMCAMEKAFKPLNRLEIPVAIAGWLLLFALMAYATVLDIHRIAA